MFFAPSKLRQRAKIWNMGLSQPSDYIQIKIKLNNPSQEPPASSETPNQELNDMDVPSPSNSRQRPEIWNMGVSRTSDHIQIKIKMPNPSHELPVSSKSLSQNLNDMEVLYFQNQDREKKCGTWVYQTPVTISRSDQDAKHQSGTSSPKKAPNQDLKDMDVLCAFKVKIESQNSAYGCTKEQ